jgi:hypothetical protein
LKDIFTIFDFKEIKEKNIHALLSMLSSEEKKIFNILKSSEDALTATQIYGLYINNLLDDNSFLKKKAEHIDFKVRNKKPLEVKAEFLRSNKVQVPTNRTITRVLENIKDIGLVVKREPSNKKAKAYYCLNPKLRILLYDDAEIRKRKEIEQMIHRVKHIKTIIQEQK